MFAGVASEEFEVTHSEDRKICGEVLFETETRLHG